MLGLIDITGLSGLMIIKGCIGHQRHHRNMDLRLVLSCSLIEGDNH